ncbi:TBC1 domain, member 5 [Boothiomyces sp. JEL0866]|nr:TBC1 domain, member 5 [Boothiomyces sp. JEL0866]
MSVTERFKQFLMRTSVEKKNDAITGEIKDFRSMYWKFFLEVLPNTADEECLLKLLDKERQCFYELKGKFIFDPRTIKDNLELNNPLSQEDDNVWKQSFADNELKATIMQDVCRTFPENRRFQDPQVREILENVLFVWCKMNPNISYRQGMHELVAIIFIVVEHDSNSYPELGEYFCHKFIDADVSILFFNLMRNVKSWYEISPPSKELTIMPIMQTCRNVMEYLKALDYELYRHLSLLEIEPQLFGMLLFCREFEIDAVMTLWDGLLADGNVLVAEWFAVSMLIDSRDELLSSDYNQLLQKLMKYTPPEKSITTQFSLAIDLRDQYSTLFADSADTNETENATKSDERNTIEKLSHIKESLFHIIAHIESIEKSSYSGPSLTIKTRIIQSEMHAVAQKLDLFLEPTLKKNDSSIVKLPISQTAEQLAGQLKAGFVGMNRAFQESMDQDGPSLRRAGARGPDKEQSLRRGPPPKEKPRTELPIIDNPQSSSDLEPKSRNKDGNEALASQKQKMRAQRITDMVDNDDSQQDSLPQISRKAADTDSVLSKKDKPRIVNPAKEGESLLRKAPEVSLRSKVATKIIVTEEDEEEDEVLKKKKGPADNISKPGTAEGGPSLRTKRVEKPVEAIAETQRRLSSTPRKEEEDVVAEEPINRGATRKPVLSGLGRMTTKALKVLENLDENSNSQDAAITSKKTVRATPVKPQPVEKSRESSLNGKSANKGKRTGPVWEGKCYPKWRILVSYAKLGTKLIKCYLVYYKAVQKILDLPLNNGGQMAFIMQMFKTTADPAFSKKMNVMNAGESVGRIQLINDIRMASVATLAPTEFLMTQLLTKEELEDQMDSLSRLPHFTKHKDFLAKTNSLFEVVVYSMGDTILTEGQAETKIYFILEGNCKCTKKVPFLQKKGSGGKDISIYESNMPVGPNEEIIEHTFTIQELETSDHFPGINPETKKLNQVDIERAALASETDFDATILEFSVTATSRIEVASIPRSDYMKFATPDMLVETIQQKNLYEVSVRQVQEGFLEKLKWDSYKKNTVDNMKKK